MDVKEEGNHSPVPAAQFYPSWGASRAPHSSPCPAAAAARGRGPKQPLHSTHLKTLLYKLNTKHNNQDPPRPHFPFRMDYHNILFPRSSSWHVAAHPSFPLPLFHCLEVGVHLQRQQRPALTAGGMGRQAEPPPRCNHSLIASIRIKPMGTTADQCCCMGWS